jgi:hypothetical protein
MGTQFVLKTDALYTGAPYLPLTGGTLTGPLTGPTFTVTGGASLSNNAGGLSVTAANGEMLRLNNPPVSVASRVDVAYVQATNVWNITAAGNGNLGLLSSGGGVVRLNPGGLTTVGVGTVLPTTSIVNLLQLSTMAGAPTGTIGSAGAAAVVIDTTNKKFCYSTGGGTWECSAAFTP